jgi:hypothetical protein
VHYFPHIYKIVGMYFIIRVFKTLDYHSASYKTSGIILFFLLWYFRRMNLIKTQKSDYEII